jgi:tRNA(Ile)-lysidine synthetase-like protein
MIKIVKEVLPKDRKYHIAVSMGVDSVAALFWMRWKGYEITPVHFNHNLRAQNAIMHDKFLRLCEKLGLEGKSEIWSKGFGTESECRDARLDFYARKAKDATIVTAHHLDDWIENYLLNCFRGHPGHNPFELESKFPDFTIVHPFLPTRKKEFLQFLDRNGWRDWVVEDDSNSVVKGSRRNWIRSIVMPEMKMQKISLEKYARIRIKKLAEGVKPC